MSNGDGFSQRELILEVRDDVRKIAETLIDKVGRREFEALQERVILMDRDGSHGLQDLLEATRENSERIDSLVGWRNRLYGMLALIAFVLPVLATISWHLWG